MVKDIRIADFDYELPDERIPRHPLVQRDACKLLVSTPSGEIIHSQFNELPDFINSGTLLVANDTRVINARMIFEKATGSKIEIFLLEPVFPSDYVLMFQTRHRCVWNCMIGNLKRWKEGDLVKTLDIAGKEVHLTARRLGSNPGNSFEVEFVWDADINFASIVEAAGNIPIPPYLKRDSEAVDERDYQTVYARAEGSVAAPTAGLHFTPEVMDALRDRHVEIMPVTLHVGAGTFQPVKSDTIGDHPMHTETFSVSLNLVKAVLDTLRTGREIIAVGTTSVRTLESLPYLGAAIAAGMRDFHVGQWWPYDPETPVKVEDTAAALQALLDYMTGNNLTTLGASTAIMIAPGFRWRLVDAMITNFHQPQSTLLLLVSSFLDRRPVATPRWRQIYDEALRLEYRFLSYGDACLLYPLM